MSRALAFGVLMSGLLALLPGCPFPTPSLAPPDVIIDLEIDGQKKNVVPMVITKGRTYWVIRPVQGALGNLAGARQAGLPADTYAFELTFSPPRPNAGFPVPDGLPSEGGFHSLDDARLVITGPNPDTFFIEKDYIGDASYSRRDNDGQSYQPLFFYQSSNYIIGKVQDTFVRPAGQSAVKVVIDFRGPFPTTTTH